MYRGDFYFTGQRGRESFNEGFVYKNTHFI